MRRAFMAVASITAMVGLGVALPVVRADVAAAVPAPPSVTLDTSGQHAFVTTAGGTAWGWGWDAYGQLGRGVANPLVSTGEPAPISVPNVRAVATGQIHTAVVTTGGQLYTFGYNADGQLGDGTTTDRAQPTLVGLSGVVGAAASCDHTIAVRSNGTVWAWGSNAYGQLGDGTTTDRLTPVQVSGLTNVVAVATGTYCFGSWSLALKSDGTVWTWGAGTLGNLGNGSTSVATTPVQASITNVANIGAGWAHSLAVKADGTVWAWGYNLRGQLGNGTTTGSATPVQAVGLTNAVAVAGGQYHSIAMRSDGSVWGWGANEGWQLGDGTMTTRHTPGASLVRNATAIAAGAYASAAVVQGGTVVEWGGMPGAVPGSPVPVPKAGIVGAQPMTATGSLYPSNDCVGPSATNVIDGFVRSTHALLRTESGPNGQSWVCVAVDDGSQHVGFKIVAGGSLTPAAVDDNQGLCDHPAYTANHIAERSLTVGPGNEPVEIDVNQFANEIWVCVKLTNTPGLAKRIVVGAAPTSAVSVLPDVSVPFAYTEAPAPAGKVSSSCQNATFGEKQRLLNVRLGTDHVWAYTWVETTNAHLCARVERAAAPAVANGAIVTLRAQGGQTFVTAGLMTDFSACPVNVVTDAGPPPAQLRTSNPGALPAALCVRVADTSLVAQATPSGSLGLASVVLDS